jgi:chemotaxis protein methyltransferase CheR
MAFTYFFRDRQTLELIRDLVVPKLRTRRYVHIWDAGCAMGPEPYSLAIMLRENMGHMSFRNVTIHASDIDTSNQFDRIISQGEYHQEQLRSVPASILERYFEPTESSGWLRVCPEIRRSVSFQRHDLLSLEPIRTNLCLILCKNVLLHFTQQQRLEVMGMFYGSLEDGGFFVTEQTQKLPDELNHMFWPLKSNAQLFQKLAN